MSDYTESDREESREYIRVEYDQSRDLSLKQESCREIDESDIPDEPEEACSHHHTDLLVYRSIITQLIQSIAREYDCPEYHSRYDERDELFVWDIWDTQLDKRNTIRDTTECVCK